MCNPPRADGGEFNITLQTNGNLGVGEHASLRVALAIVGER